MGREAASFKLDKFQAVGYYKTNLERMNIMSNIDQKKWRKLYNVKLSGFDLERIFYVFNEEENDHEANIKNGFTGYEGILDQTKSILKRIRPIVKRNSL